MIYHITSLENKIVKYTFKLKNNISFMKKEHSFILEGKHLLELADISKIKYIISLKEVEEKEYKDIDQYIVNENIMKKLSSYDSFSSLIFVYQMDNISINSNNNLDLLNNINDKIVLYLDHLQDLGNIGTIIRTALAFNIKTIISTNPISFYNFKTIQSSKGAILKTNLYGGDIGTLKYLINNKGYKLIVSTLKEDSIFLSSFKVDKTSKYILALGNEGNGISKEVEDLSSVKVKIDISNIDSLNVAIAGSIFMYHLTLK